MELVDLRVRRVLGRTVPIFVEKMHLSMSRKNGMWSEVEKPVSSSQVPNFMMYCSTCGCAKMWKTWRWFWRDEGVDPVKVWNALTRLHDDKRSLSPLSSGSVRSSLKSPIMIDRDPLEWSCWTAAIRSSMCCFLGSISWIFLSWVRARH